MQDILAPMVLENLECIGTEARLVDCPRISPEAVADDDYSSYTQSSRCDPLQANYAFVACGTTSGPRAPSPCTVVFTWSLSTCLYRRVLFGTSTQHQ